MQLTLVSHYGPKPPEFARLITDLQDLLSRQLGRVFRPYAREQVHATLIGLEGHRVGNNVRGENFWRLRGEERWIDFESLLAFLRSASFPAFTVQVGGFRAGLDYRFTSQGKHPQARSFSLQKNVAVAMGWPKSGDTFPTALDLLRRRFQSFGVLHKWHDHPDAADNDWFFVLGRVDAEVSAATRSEVETSVRQRLAAREPCLISITPQSLRFVAYTDPQLCPEHSRVIDFADEVVTPALLRSVYDV
jgi:hypothetical protein